MTTTKAAPQPKVYDDTSFDVLEGILPVFVRPGMYIGNTGKSGLHHLVWEVIDNSVDEAMVPGGTCDRIDVTINEDNSVTVEDNGRGIPVTKYKTGTHKGKPTVEIALTVLHAGGKFKKDAYSLSGGLHGVGISVVNALSNFVNVEIRRPEGTFDIGFESIKKEGKQTDPGVCTKKLRKVGPFDPKLGTGTAITFLPNDEVFGKVRWDAELISNRLMLAAVLNPGIVTTIEDRRVESRGERVEFFFENGIEDYMHMLAGERLRDGHHASNEGEEVEDTGAVEDDEELRSRLLPSEPIHLGQDFGDEGAWDLVMQWFPDHTYNVLSYANGIHTVDHGTHVQGFQSNITRIVNAYARQEHVALLTDRDSNLELSDIQSGMGVIIAAKVSQPQFEGQTKGRLGNPETRKMIGDGFRSQFMDWLQSHPVEAGMIISRMVDEMRIRERLRAEEEAARGGDFEAVPAFEMTPPEKLKDITGRDRSHAELFIVEGDSAMVTALDARDNQTQAILPIRGKIRNSGNSSMEKLARNREIKGVLYAIGAGSLSEVDIDKARYEKVVILTDADDDGFHIQCLVLTMLMTFVPELVQAGRVYIGRPPLFSTNSLGLHKVFVSSIAEREEIEAAHPKKNIEWVRFKGLGEMDASELRESAMDRETRMIYRVLIEDMDEALHKMHLLMGADSVPKIAAIHAAETDELDDEN